MAGLISQASRDYLIRRSRMVFVVRLLEQHCESELVRRTLPCCPLPSVNLPELDLSPPCLDPSVLRTRCSAVSFGTAPANAYPQNLLTNPAADAPARKIPWRLSPPQKYRHRKRLQRVDEVIDTLESALKKQGESIAAIERWRHEMPTEAEMEARDKYTMFDRKSKTYRKGVHSEFPGHNC